MIILGIILLIAGFLLKISILWTIGIILVVIGVILAILEATGHAIASRRHSSRPATVAPAAGRGRCSTLALDHHRPVLAGALSPAWCSAARSGEFPGFRIPDSIRSGSKWRNVSGLRTARSVDYSN